MVQISCFLHSRSRFLRFLAEAIHGKNQQKRRATPLKASPARRRAPNPSFGPKKIGITHESTLDGRATTTTLRVVNAAVPPRDMLRTYVGQSAGVIPLASPRVECLEGKVPPPWSELFLD